MEWPHYILACTQLYKIWGYEILITKLHIPRISSPKISVEHCPYSMPCGGVHQMRLYNSWSKGTKQFIPIKSSILDENGWYTWTSLCTVEYTLEICPCTRDKKNSFPPNAWSLQQRIIFVKHWSSHSKHWSSVRSQIDRNRLNAIGLKAWRDEIMVVYPIIWRWVLHNVQVRARFVCEKRLLSF